MIAGGAPGGIVNHGTNTVAASPPISTVAVVDRFWITT
jgi:hypothetical protein